MPEQTKDNDRLLRVEQVAETLAVGRTQAYQMCRAGEIPVMRIGKLIRVSAKALDQWIAEQTKAEAGQGA